MKRRVSVKFYLWQREHLHLHWFRPAVDCEYWRAPGSVSSRSAVVLLHIGLAVSLILYGLSQVPRLERPITPVQQWLAVTAQSLGTQAPIKVSYDMNVSGHRVEATTVAQLVQYFEDNNYNLAAVKKEDAVVPRVFLNKLPEDFDAASPDARKEIFMQTMLPLIMQANGEIEADREKLKAIHAKRQADEPLSWVEKRWLKRIAAQYQVDMKGNYVERLLTRVAPVPNALALSQAALESGWGTSRFAVVGNAMFGVWTWKKSDMGVLPLRRDADKTHRIKAYDTLKDSVRDYMLTLNTHRGYREFRTMRHNMMQKNNINSAQLANTLIRYSTMREKYIAKLHYLIKKNDLNALEDAQFPPTTVLAATQ